MYFIEAPWAVLTLVFIGSSLVFLYIPTAGELILMYESESVASSVGFCLNE